VSVFSFVLAENARFLVEAEFTFLQGLLGLLKPSAGIFVLDCTFKYFPLIEGMAESQGWETKRPAWPCCHWTLTATARVSSFCPGRVCSARWNRVRGEEGV